MLKRLLIITIFLSFQVHAETLIRDAEINNLLYDIANPIFKVAKLKDVRIIIVNSDQVNAFTDGENIFIYSGMLIKFPDINVLQCVLAHEISHVLLNHVPRQMFSIDHYKNISLGGAALGIIGSLLTANPTPLAMASVAGGADYFERSILKHSRYHEASADRSACNLLKKTQISNEGFLKLFDYFKLMSFRHDDIDPYLLSHPLSDERTEYVANNINKGVGDNNELQEKLNFAIIKLKSFLEKDQKISTDNSDLSLYANAIIYFKQGNKDQSLSCVNKLIKNYPKNPYFHEFKGEMLFNYGDKEAIKSYNQAVSLLPDDVFIRFNRAIVLMNIDPKDKSIEEDLNYALSIEPENLLFMHYAATYYDKVGKKGESLLMLADIAMKKGDKLQAKKFATMSLGYLKEKSTKWQKAKDIIYFSNL